MMLNDLLGISYAKKRHDLSHAKCAKHTGTKFRQIISKQNIKHHHGTLNKTANIGLLPTYLYPTQLMML